MKNVFGRTVFFCVPTSMSHFDKASLEAASAILPGNRTAPPDGWRKITTGLIDAERIADEGVRLNHDRTRCVVAVKRIGVQIGLKAADLLLLDTLTAFTQPQDWEEGQRPIVWASNAFLMERTGFSLSTLKRHARRLAEAGVIAFRDSPNGKRWGRRTTEGAIVEAYGFDLSPLSVRVEEFEALAVQHAEERALCQRLRRQITIARRSIRAQLEAAQAAGQGDGRLARTQAAFEALLSRLPGPRAAPDVLRSLLQQFSNLLRQLGAYVSIANERSKNDQQNQEMNPSRANTDPRILITSQLPSVDCNPSENEERENHQRKQKAEASAESKERSRVHPIGIELQTVLHACPEFVTWGRNLGRDIRGWRDFVRVAEDLRPMVGISEDAWAAAGEQMGKPAAAAALALVFEKVHAGEVTSPGGYLRGMVAKAGVGELHLARSFFGRIRAQAA